MVLFSHEKLTISEVNSHIGQHRPSIQICADKRQTSLQVAIKSISPSPYEIIITKDDDKSVARILDVIHSLVVQNILLHLIYLCIAESCANISMVHVHDGQFISQRRYVRRKNNEPLVE